ncbi:MAG: hypothetical protein RQ847_02165 [Wenzhouxiangellaceae bacterium]|nr:hypothetical protein [Wenzhouxiangellaceae bacterium]
MILEILLMGLVVVAVYFVAHHITMAVDRAAARPLGAWRSAVFFVAFLALLLAAIAIRGWLVGGG